MNTIVKETLTNDNISTGTLTLRFERNDSATYRKKDEYCYYESSGNIKSNDIRQGRHSQFHY